MKWKQAAMLFFMLGLAGYSAHAQAPFPVDTSEFARNASEVTKVSLDKNMLQFAAKFMASGGEQDQEAQNIINHLDGIYVYDFTYKRPGSYSAAAVEAIRRKLRAPEWNQIITERGKGADAENTDVYVHTRDGKIAGMFVIDAEPDELALVEIVGPIDPNDLKALGGHFGVPAVGGVKGRAKDGDPGGAKKGATQ